MFPFRKRLSKAYRVELQELNRLELYLNSIAGLVKENTALVPNGQKFARQFEAVAKLVTNHKQNFMAQVLTQMGIPKASINIHTGVIKPLKHDVQPDASKTPKE